MAGNYRIYYYVDGVEHSVDTWLELDHPTIDDHAVRSAVLNEVPAGKAPGDFRVIDLDLEGKPTLYDEFLIQDRNKGTYGVVYRAVGQEGWFYLSDHRIYQFKFGHKILSNTFIINGMPKDLGVTIATIDWERLSVLVNDQELFLVPWSPSPFK